MSDMDTRSPLAKLIDTARAPEKLSYQDISDRAERHGVELSKSNINRVMNAPGLVTISSNLIQGLALGLGLSERRVAVAALESMGVSLELQATPLRQAILDTDEVGERTKRILLSVLQTEDDVDDTQIVNINRQHSKWRKTGDQAKSSDLDERLAPAADDVIPDVDELPGGSDERD